MLFKTKESQQSIAFIVFIDIGIEKMNMIACIVLFVPFMASEIALHQFFEYRVNRVISIVEFYGALMEHFCRVNDM